MGSQHDDAVVIGSVALLATAQTASPASERDCPQSRALVVRREHRAGEQPSAEALETLREWALAHGCGGLEAGWRATTQTRHHDGPTSGQVDRYYYSPSGETIGPTALMPPTESLIVITATTTNCVRRAAEVAPRGRKVCSPAAPQLLCTSSPFPLHLHITCIFFARTTLLAPASPHHPLSPRLCAGGLASTAEEASGGSVRSSGPCARSSASSEEGWRCG